MLGFGSDSIKGYFHSLAFDPIPCAILDREILLPGSADIFEAGFRVICALLDIVFLPGME